jgi:hypothetical protein
VASARRKARSAEAGGTGRGRRLNNLQRHPDLEDPTHEDEAFLETLRRLAAGVEQLVEALAKRTTGRGRGRKKPRARRRTQLYLTMPLLDEGLWQKEFHGRRDATEHAVLTAARHGLPVAVWREILDERGELVRSDQVGRIEPPAAVTKGRPPRGGPANGKAG